MNALSNLAEVEPLRSDDEEKPRAEHTRRRVWEVESVKQQKRAARDARSRAAYGIGDDRELLELSAEIDATRPKTRADCINVMRPCHFLSCKFKLALEVTPSGSIRSLNEDEFAELETSNCALDVAERGGITLEEVGSLVGVTRERVRQIEEKATARMRELHSRGV